MLYFGRRSRKDSNTSPFPVRQMFVLALCRLAEPIAFMSIFPYVYFMIESFHITTDDRKISFYAGMVTSAFAFAEFSSSMVWGRMSDRYGRKPILLCGLAGTGISMVMFGLAPNLPTALVARALGGLLNGNIGVLQSTVAEVVTVEEHQPRAYAIMPVVWCVGSIAGSAIGGLLADPVRSYGWSAGSIWERFPFLLPNLVCTGVVILAMLVGIFFLEETHEDKKHKMDRGVEVGKWILGRFTRQRMVELSSRKSGVSDETYSLVRQDSFDCPPDYRSTASSPELSPSAAPEGVLPPAYHSIENSPRSSLFIDDSRTLNGEADAEALGYELKAQKRNVGVTKAFTRPVVMIIVSYGILAYHTISAEQLLPVLFSLPESAVAPSLPFKFTGGFGMPTKSIGGILSAQGLIQVISTVFVFPVLSRRLGNLTLFRITAFSYPFLYLIVPYLTLISGPLRTPAIYAVLVWKVSAQAFTFPPALIMMANNTPSPKVSGTLNGAMGAAASLCRGFGPTFSGLLQSAGLSVGALGLPWWTNACIATIGALLSLCMVEQKLRTFETEKEAAACEEREDLALVVETMQFTPSSPIATRSDRRCSRA